MSTISIMIPALNEEKHIQRLIPELFKLNIPFFILGSYKKGSVAWGNADQTELIAKKFKAPFYKCHAKNLSEKLNYGLNLNPFKSDWIIRLDADEYLDLNFIRFLKENKISEIRKEFDSIYINRKVYFMGSWMKYGGIYPGKTIRIVRPKKVRYENKPLDEKIICKNPTFLNVDVIDDPLYSLDYFLKKHIFYASKYADDYIANGGERFLKLMPGQSKLKITLQNIFLSMPLFIRPFFYWFYRYVLRFGFLDGTKGFIFNFFHAFLYRFIIDSFIFEKKKRIKK